MRVSKEKREETRRALVTAAVDLFANQGYENVSIREVASRAGVAPATAYKYFASKDRLFHAYFELKQQDAQAAWQQVEGVDDFDLKEKLHAFLECLLAEYIADREFVRVAMQGMMDAPMQAIGGMRPAKRGMVTLIERLVQEAVEEGELPDAPFQTLLIGAFWDYSNLIVLYWLKDDTEGFSRTSELIDKSLDLYVATLRSAIVSRAARLLEFVVKSHIYGNWDDVTSLLGRLGSTAKASSEGADDR